MLIYMFTSEASPNLYAFAGDPSGSKLPESHAPWTATGSIKSPHRFCRAKIEEAIKLSSFQLWRLKPARGHERAAGLNAVIEGHITDRRRVDLHSYARGGRRSLGHSDGQHEISAKAATANKPKAAFRSLAPA
jgi:hypothetical protein